MTVPASAQEPTAVPEQGPLSARERQEEVLNFARGQQAADSAEPQEKKPEPVQGFWDRLLHGVEGKNRALEIARSIPRGAANAVNAAIQTGLEGTLALAQKVGLTQGTEEEKKSARQGLKKSAPIAIPTDRVFGARSDDPLASFTESAAQATTSMLVLRRAGVTNLVAGGAITDAVAFNPYEAGVSELLEQHGDKLPVAGNVLSQLGKLGSVEDDDGFAEARIKRVVEGGVVGGVIGLVADAVRWGNKRLRAEAAGDVAGVKEADKVLDAIEEGTHVPEGTRVAAKPNGDGTWRVEEVTPDRSIPQDEILGVPAKGTPGNTVHDIGDGGKVVIARNAEGAATGYLQLQQSVDREGFDVLDVLVDKTTPRQGIATSLYKTATDEGLKPRSGMSSLSDAGDKLTQKLAAQGLTERDVPPNPRFTRAEAVTQAATMDHAIRMAEQPNGKQFTDADLKIHFETAEKIRNAATEREAIDLVGSEDHFNLGAIGSGDDFNAQLRALVSKYNDAFSSAKGRPVVSHAETLAAAESYAKDLGITDWVARVSRAANDAERLKLSVETVLKVSGVRQVGERMVQLAKARGARPHDPAIMTEARRMYDAWQGLSLDAFAHDSELGRSMNVLLEMSQNRQYKVRFKNDLKARPASADAPTAPAAKAAATEAAPTEAVRLSSSMSDEEMDIALRLFSRSHGEPRHLPTVVKSMERLMKEGAEREAKKTPWAKIEDRVTTYFINSLISGVKTAQSIFQSGMAMNAFEATSRVLAGTVTLNRDLVQEGAAYMYAMARYARENVKSAGLAFRENRSVLEGSPPMNLNSGAFNTVVTVPGRIAGSIDEYTRITAYRAEEFAKSLRAARESGLSWNDAVKRAEADVRASVDSETGIALNPAALEKAGIPTLSNPLGADTWMGKAANIINDVPYLRLVIPFMKPSVNTFRYVWQNTPGLNWFNKRARQIMLEGGEEAAVLHTRSAMAGSMMYFAASLFDEGRITGDGPGDPTMRKIWLKNHQPYSIRVGDTWISYRRMEPFASFIGSAADYAEARNELDDNGESQSIGAAFFSATLKNTYNKSWTVGAADLLTAIREQDSDSHAFDRVVRGIMAGFTPQAIAQFNDDPYMREMRGLLDGSRARIRGLSKDLPPKYNLVGEAVMKQGSLWNRNFSTFQTKSAEASILEDALLENNINLTPFPSKLAYGQIDLMDERWEKNGKLPYARFMEILKENGLRKELETAVKSPAFKRHSAGTSVFPGGQREDDLRVIKDAAEEKALNQMLKEYKSTGLADAWKGANFVLPNMAKYKGPDGEAATREKYGIPVPQ